MPKNFIVHFRALISLFCLIFAATSVSAETRARAARSFPREETYFIKTKPKKGPGLICGIQKKKIVIAVLQSQSDTKVQFRRFKPKNASEQKLQIKAERECKSLRKRSACGDRRDNDLDGLIDFPREPGCSSAIDSDETDPVITPGALQIFRKPFIDEFSLASLFDHNYPLEFIHTDGLIVSSYNEKTTSLGVDGHQGYDFLMPTGTPILAAADGVVEFAGIESPFYCPLLDSTVAGMTVRIRHEIQGEILYSIYAHFSSIKVTEGQIIAKGSQLGLSGNTGCSTAPHLHFDIAKSTSANGATVASIDPYGWNSNEVDPWSAHPLGTSSLPLWTPGEAPEPFRFSKLAPNPNTGDAASVAITFVRFAGWEDSLNLNNEVVELALDPRFASSGTFNLTGYTLSNLVGERFAFPSGFKIKSGHPVRVYTGEGTNSDHELYWNKSSPAWSNSGDCVQLKSANNFRLYFHFYGSQGCGSNSLHTERGATGHGTFLVKDFNPLLRTFRH